MKSSELMECKSPDFTKSLQGALCAIPENRNRKKRDTDDDSEFIFYVGFGFDGHDKYVNISAIPELQQYGQLLVKPDPKIRQFTESDDIRRLEDGEDLVQIKGEDLKSGKKFMAL